MPTDTPATPPTRLTNDRRARPPLPTPLARLLEPLYRAELNRRNNRYDRNVRVHRAPIPVASVGNLSVGGTGKTPFVAAVCQHLRELGHTPGIALRGYKATTHQPADETLEHNRRNPRTPVRAHRERRIAVQDLAQLDAATVAVLDDGFQHRTLHRDLDIVLIDATRDPFADRCLPAGWLREPPSALRRAHVAVLSRADLAEHHARDAIERNALAINPDLTLAHAEHRWAELLDGNDHHRPLDTLADIPVTVACGIGHPAAFLAAARQHRARVEHTLIKHDHHRWSAKESTDLFARLPHDHVLLTTEKDWVKLAPLVPEELRQRTLRPRLTIAITKGEHELIHRLRTLPAPCYPEHA